MFTLDLQVARQNCHGPEDVVLIFVVRLSDERNLPVYLPTSKCLLLVMENIKKYRNALKEYINSFGYSYSFLKCVGYYE